MPQPAIATKLPRQASSPTRARRIGVEIVVDAVADPVGGGHYGIPDEMIAPPGCLQFRLHGQVSNLRLPFAEGQGLGGEGIPEFVNSRSAQFGARVPPAPTLAGAVQPLAARSY